MTLSVFSAAADAPDRVALITDEETLTYAELAERVRLLEDRLALVRKPAGGANRPVPLVARRSIETFVLLHALIATGTPALLLHPRLTEPERARLLEAAGLRPADLLDPSAPDAPASQSPARDPALSALTVGPSESSPRERGPTVAADRAAFTRSRVRADDASSPAGDGRALAIVHTSGTSGHPRGVVLSHRAFLASAEASAANLGWRDGDRWLLPLPLAHVGGLSILTRCLIARRTVVMAGGTDPRELMRAVRRHRVTLLSLVPTLLRRILDLESDDDSPPDHLRAVLLGGAPASPQLLGEAVDRGWPVLTTYGLTEACSQVTTQRYRTHNRGEAGSGPALPGIDLRIGDNDQILVRGPTLFSGYLPPEPESPFTPDGWFPTGDFGRLDEEGHLHVLGRRTDRIITGGENVDPLEVEAALEALPSIREACVFGVPDEQWGEVVCAAVVGREAGTGDEAGSGDKDGGYGRVSREVESLRSRMAPFKLPRRLALLDSLPTNATGKVDRRETARRAEGRLRPL